MTIPEGLLADVKNQINITWTDEATDAKISSFILLGMIYLDDKLGEPADYTMPGKPRTLLFEYVRYANSEALDVFENNYRALILSMQTGRAVSVYVESTKQTT